MASMRHVENFDQLILNSFEEIINQRDLKFESLGNEFADDIRLTGPACELQFTYDRGDLRCSFINPLTKRKYLVNLVYNLLYPNDKDFIFSINVSNSYQIATYAEVIMRKLLNVLDGDFSWTAKYDKVFN